MMGLTSFRNCFELQKNMHHPSCLLMKLMPLEQKVMSQIPVWERNSMNNVGTVEPVGWISLVKVMATNWIETLDPALVRPGHIDRKIEFPLPVEKTKKHIFQIHTSRMMLADDAALDDLIMAKDGLSGTNIKAICTEAGLMALREYRMKTTNEDFKKI